MARGKSFTGFSALMLALVATPAALLAQSSTTSALTGLVRDAKGKPLPGATVRISSSAMIGGEKVMRTAENGTYRFPMLPPGRFRIVVETPGLTSLSGSELLELGRTSTVNWKFAAAASAVVEVVESAANMDATPVGVTANYNTTELATLPTERTLSGIMNLTPGVNSTRAWGGDSRDNAYMMDGINISDPQSNSRWIEPNPDWFSEIQVGGIGAPAEFGNFNGGFVNGILKRGGNETTGSFSGYYADNKWEALSSNKDSRFTSEDRQLAPAKNWDMALNIGGPILKDKLWYFASVERKESEETPIGAAISSRRSELLALTKLTWQVIPSATLEGVFEYDYTSHDRRGIKSYIDPEATNKETAPNHSYGLTWTQSIGSDKVLTLKAFGYSGHYDEPGYNGEQYGLDASDNYKGVEYYHNALPVNYNYRARSSVSATFDFFKTSLIVPGDNHAFRMGIEQEWVTDKELQRNPGGIGLMGTLDTDANGNDIVMTDYFWTGGGYDIKEHANRTSAFVQDTWTINDRLTLRPGIRLEQQKANAFGHSTLWNTKTVAPRFGVTYALTADQRNLLKFHWGRFYSAFSASYIDRQYPEMAPAEVQYKWGDPANGYSSVQIDPRNYASWPMPGDPATWVHQATVSSYSVTDPDAKQPYMDETTLSLEHKFKGPWTASATYLYRVNKDNLLRKDVAADSGSSVVEDFDDYRSGQAGTVSVPVWYSSVASDAHQWVVTNIPEAKRAFWSATLAVSRSFQDNWSLNASYTRARRYGNTFKSNGYDTLFENPNNLTNSNGLLPGFDDDEVKIHGLYEFPWKMRVSGTFTYLSGEHWTPYVRTSRINGTRYYINVEPRGSRTYPSESLLDLRLTQIVPLTQKINAEAFVEVFNVFNIGAALAWKERADVDSYMLPSSVESGRRVRLGFRINF